MNSTTREIHERKPGETREQMAARLGTTVSNLVELARKPNPRCPVCKGSGHRPRRGQKPQAMFKFYEPCECCRLHATHPRR